MNRYRQQLPQANSKIFLTDGGLETTLVFHEGIELPHFAAFYLLFNDRGIEVLKDYYLHYLRIAHKYHCGFILETPTWRANPDWIEKIDCGGKTLPEICRRAVGLMLELRADCETAQTPIVISGNIGPRGDGYLPTERMSVDEAKSYHLPQIQTFAQTDADMAAAVTINYVEEAIGIVLAAKQTEIPVAISFTVETNGKLPDGTTLGEAISRTDEATDNFVAYYMINCAHPTHFSQVLAEEGGWRKRIRGLRANASCKSHAELDESPTLDEGNPSELGQQYREFLDAMPWLRVLGGCCGTDHRHVSSIAAACCS